MSVINSYNMDSSPPKSLLLLDKSAVFIEQHFNSTYMYYSTTPTHVTWKSLYVFVDTVSRARYKVCTWSLGSVSIQEPTSLVCVFFFMKQRHRLWKYHSRRHQDEINIDESLTNILRGRMQDPSWEKIFAKILLMLFRLFQVAGSREKKPPLPSLKVSW